MHLSGTPELTSPFRFRALATHLSSLSDIATSNRRFVVGMRPNLLSLPPQSIDTKLDHVAGA